MGQYYNIVLNKKVHPSKYIDKSGDVYFNGIKLMEFNWLKNPITQIIAKELYERKTKLALVGDYADDVFQFPRDLINSIREENPEIQYYYQAKEKARELGYEPTNVDFPQIELDYETLMEIYEAAWQTEQSEHELLVEPKEEFTEWENLYFINHTKKQFIDLIKYIEKSTTSDNRCISPFIITAIGNGMGGGDYRIYRSKSMDQPPHRDKIGYWAYDLLSIEEHIPKNYTELEVYFKEED